MRECMAEFLGTFVLMVSDFELDCNFQNQSNGFLKKKKKIKAGKQFRERGVEMCICISQTLDNYPLIFQVLLFFNFLNLCIKRVSSLSLILYPHID